MIGLRSRIIPALLMHRGGLVKTVRFSDPKYVGDPINAVRIFNEKQVDELVVLDIDASRSGAEPNYELISAIARECRMPLSYGGGIRAVGQIERIIGLGVEKVCIGAAAVENLRLLSEAAHRVGSQSVAAVIDVKKTGLLRRHEVVIKNATIRTGKDPVEFARELEEAGVGEIVLNSVDHDGTMEGYDMELIDRVREAVQVPMTVLGGASSLQDIEKLVKRHGPIGAGAGSLFVFKGKYRAVLINYPNRGEKASLLAGAKV